MRLVLSRLGPVLLAVLASLALPSPLWSQALAPVSPGGVESAGPRTASPSLPKCIVGPAAVKAAGTGLDITTLEAGLTAYDLAQCLVGSGVTVTSAEFAGSWSAAGLFTGGTSIIGIEQGLLLSTGRAGDAIGPNVSDDWSTTNGTDGDSQLAALVGLPTYDAAVLSFDFIPNGDRVYFEYVFSSEEYNEYVNREYDDVFGFFVNGVNVATVGSPAVPVSVNTINNGNPYGSDPRSHPEFYTSNSMADGTAYLDTEMDGLTTVLVCEAAVVKGATNHMTLAVADVSDALYDSDVFIQADSLSTKPDAAFAPKPDGWRLENGSDTDPSGDWAVWRHLFGYSEKSITRYEAEVAQAKADGYKGIFDGGNCYGFAASSAAYYTGDRDLAANVLGLAKPWNFGPTSSGYPINGRLNGAMNPTVLREIEEFQLAQFETLTNKTEAANSISDDYSWGWWWGPSYKDELAAWLDRLASALEVEPQIVTFGSKTPKVEGDGGGHGVVAYRMSVEQGGDLVKLFVYDNNWPGDDSRFIAFWPQVPKWQYNLFGGETWGSADKGDRISFYRAFWPAWAVNSSSVVGYLDTKWSVSHAGEVTFRDDSGNVSGFAAGSWEIPGLVPKPRYDARPGARRSSVSDFVVPDPDAVSAAVKPDGTGAYTVTAPGDEADVYISGAWAPGTVAGGTPDSVRVSAQGTSVRVQPAAAAAMRLVLASDYGAPSLALDLAFEPGDSTDREVGVRMSPLDSGIAVDIENDSSLARPTALGWLGAKATLVPVAQGARVRLELTGGEAAGEAGQATSVAVLTDADADGTWDSEMTDQVAPLPDHPRISFGVPGPKMFAQKTRGVAGRRVSLRYCGKTPFGDGLTRVRIVVKNARGRVVARIGLGARTSGQWYAAKWRPSRKGTYRYFVYGRDSLGVAQSLVGTARVVIR